MKILNMIYGSFNNKSNVLIPFKRNELKIRRARWQVHKPTFSRRLICFQVPLLKTMSANG